MRAGAHSRIALGRLAVLAVLALLCLTAPTPAQEAAPADSAAVQVDDTPRGAVQRVWLFIADLFGLSDGNLKTKLLRVAAILVIVLVAKLILAVAQRLSRWMIYSTWGPLKLVFRDHQRSVTIHALLLSLTKYVVYFTALGYILRELGIDYKTYLASLSLIGIAIGFGSQGLVQDVVTGFFILFENQFKVGDMVEISGQTGFVEDIGLRTTRIRNYFGAAVVLQNRNIPMAVRYPSRAFQAVIDVAVPSRDLVPRGAQLAQRVGVELHRQFQEIIMAPPRVVGWVELQTGELFVRLQAEIWPLQQWVVDTQLLPRIREAFARETIPIPGDRVVAFYHRPPEAASLPGVVHPLDVSLDEVAS